MKQLEEVAATLLDGIEYTSYEQVRCASYGVPGPALLVGVTAWAEDSGWKRRYLALVEERGWMKLPRVPGGPADYARPDGAFVVSRVGGSERGFAVRTREFYGYLISPKAGP